MSLGECGNTSNILCPLCNGRGVEDKKGGLSTFWKLSGGILEGKSLRKSSEGKSVARYSRLNGVKYCPKCGRET